MISENTILGIVFTGLFAGMLRFPDPANTSVCFWIIILVLFGVAFLLQDRSGNTPFRNPFQGKGEGCFLVLLVIVVTIVTGFDVTHWRWTGIPDESHFFMTAKRIIDGEFTNRFIL